MSGHSHWHSIRHKKQLTDNRKGKIFSKLAKIISIAAKKGGDPNMNPSLRLAIEKAKQSNMPNDNIQRAIKRGTGEDKSAMLEEITYEAYGPNGTALIIEAITDNRNRTVSELKHILSNHNGKIAEKGSVKYLFDKTADGWNPKYSTEINEDLKNKLTKLFEELDENEDVKDIYSNVNL